MTIFKEPHPLGCGLKDFDNGCKWVCFWTFDELGVIGCIIGCS
jgi:hypothetical protein